MLPGDGGECKSHEQEWRNNRRNECQSRNERFAIFAGGLWQLTCFSDAGDPNMTATRVFLHVGCGHSRKAQTTAGFRSDAWDEVRLDIDPSVAPDVVGTLTDMAAVATASVDAVFSSHNIEHLYPHEVPLALAEFKRVLKPGGFAVITCPDLQPVAALIADDRLTDTAYVSPAGPITPLDILFGHRASMQRGNLFMAHHCGFTRKVLAATLQAAGFGMVAARSRPEALDLWAVATAARVGEDEIKAIAAQHFP